MLGSALCHACLIRVARTARVTLAENILADGHNTQNVCKLPSCCCLLYDNVLLLTTLAFVAVIAASGEHHPDRVISLAVSVSHQIRLLTDVKHLIVLTIVVS